MKTDRLLRRSGRRRGISGVLAALIMFAMIFTAGAGYFIDINSANHASDQGLAMRDASMQQAALENLSLTVKLIPAGVPVSVLVLVNNTGGTSLTIRSIFVTDPNGQQISGFIQGPLAGGLGLNSTLPLSISSGSSKGITCAALTCLGAIQPPNFLVSVLTNSGNVFSVLFPSPTQVTVKNVVQVNGLEQVDVGQSQVDVVNEYQIIGCYKCASSLEGGGEALVLEIAATPSPVSEGGTVTVSATVYDESSYVANGVEVSLYAVGAGAYVTPTATEASPVACPQSATPEGIGSFGSYTFTCTFQVYLNSGSTIGSVTFVGEAAGSITVSNKTQATDSGTSSSNPVQVGSASFGAFQLNYYYFGYTGCTSGSCTGSQPCVSQTSLCSAAVISHSEEDAAFFVQVTNTYGSPLSIIDGSYLQFVSPGTDLDEYLVNAVCYPTSCGSPTITPYGCFATPGSALADSVVGQSCLTINPGQTVTMVFAASGPASSSWKWGSSNPGGDTGVGEAVQIILEYATTSGGVATSINAQNIPFQAVYIN